MISIIIPMYNAEKFIGQCLQSILEQTFNEFEVIVVDDASTDRSVDIVNSITPKFDGRLILVRRENNSGGMVAIPRNIGLGMARGDYIMFVDNDDLLTKNALEKLHALAVETNADVLNSSRFFYLRPDGSHPIASFEKCPPVDKPTLLDDNLAQHVDDFINYRFHFNVWTKFFRRRFLVENGIRFPELPASDDMFFSFYCLMRAKHYVRIPNPFYVWRVRDDSVSHEKLSPEDAVRKWITIAVEGTSQLERFMDRTPFFNQNPRARFAVLHKLIHDQLHYLYPIYASTPIRKITELTRAELERHSVDTTTLLAYVINGLNVARLQIAQLQKQLSSTVQGG